MLHYDGDYDLIAAVTGQPMRWVIPRRGHPPTSARLQPRQRSRRATRRAEPDRRNDRPAALLLTA
jgi:hypothetical protein